VPTVTRMPRMQGFPPITLGSRVMRVSCGLLDGSCSPDLYFESDSPPVQVTVLVSLLPERTPLARDEDAPAISQRLSAIRSPGERNVTLEDGLIIQSFPANQRL
jgi:hypothetical protein